MAWNKTSGFALLLIGLGVLVLLNNLGFGLGTFMGLLFPALMIVLSYVGIRNGRTLIGTVLLAVGLIVLFGKLSGLIGWIVAIALIYFGFRILARRSSVV